MNNVFFLKFFGHDFRSIRKKKDGIEYNPIEIDNLSARGNPTFKFFLDSKKELLEFKSAVDGSKQKLFDISFLIKDGGGQDIHLKIKSINSFLFQKDKIEYVIPSENYMNKLGISASLQNAVTDKEKSLFDNAIDLPLEYLNLLCLIIEFNPHNDLKDNTEIIMMLNYYPDLSGNSFAVSKIISTLENSKKVARLGTYDVSDVETDNKDILSNMANPYLVKANNEDLTVKSNLDEEIQASDQSIQSIKNDIEKITSGIDVVEECKFGLKNGEFEDFVCEEE
jgi:hypothetical protein